MLLSLFKQTVPGYSLTRSETIYLTLPASSVSSASPIRVSPPLIITPSRRFARFGGHLVDYPEGSTLRSDALSNLTIILEDDVWDPKVGQPHLGKAERDLQLSRGIKGSRRRGGGCRGSGSWGVAQCRLKCGCRVKRLP